MASVEDKINEIQEEIDKTPKNKGTEHHIGKLKAKIARLRGDQQKAASSGKKGSGYSIKKAGDATVVIVGFPSVGKSTLLNKITNADSKIGDYEFTTLDVIPGIMEYKGANIQVLDVPGIISGAAEGKGRGKEILSIARISDLILIMVDVSRIEDIEIIKKELHRANLRLNMNPPKIGVIKKTRGGILIRKTVKLTKISERTIKSILNEYSIHNAEIIIREDVDVERFIDSLMTNRIYVPMFVLLNKIDLISENELKKIVEKIKDEKTMVSVKNEKNLENLKREIFEKLGFIRVYTKPHGKEIKYDEPLIIKKGATVLDFCREIHKDFAKSFDFARVWGSTKFEGQRVSTDYVLKDKDVIQINLKK